MGQLKNFRDLHIDWDMTPEQAVVLYLEWGNNDWHSAHPPVRSKDDYSTYFVVSTWEGEPSVSLIRRNSDGADELATLTLPPNLVKDIKRENGNIKGVFEPTPAVKEWLKSQIEN